ncbi:cell division transport system permease protein [Ferrithrix thermotolerans DSM 19514]|uniref:Cell division protein FtsX n=1 Tax=Ferrithrix thermotolerans DSM 19514 TaxID=1121881 RepID=A0A1M4S6L6_9ACTN|nr:permease-like cell division protein FtsX [Ferrithrix thermotolerans]SHE27842.1 cell division transport system permease protein [Ferrithrix thermotolerans DSM 19514]
MGLSVEYVVRETAGNLWRNRLMSLAAMLTIAVSLALVGSALLLKQGVATSTQAWKGGVQLLIFMQPNATKSQDRAVVTQLQTLPSIEKYFYVDKAVSYQEFRRLFANQPDLLNSVSESQIPPSYRVVLKNPSEAPSIGQIFNGQPGVKAVDYNFAAIQTLEKISSIAQGVIIGLAVILLLSATVLILNVIRVAIFSRRREVMVMKLVGATNWFIRIPFMLEGFTQGLLGALIAAGAVLAIRALFNYLIERFQVHLLSGFVLTSHDVLMTEIVVFVVGVVVGTMGSALAVRRYLEV